MLLDSTTVFVFFHLSAQSNLGLLKKGELFDYRQIEGNANTKYCILDVLFLAYLKHLCDHFINYEIHFLGHEQLLPPFGIICFG